jgi:hypothetical protein
MYIMFILFLFKNKENNHFLLLTQFVFDKFYWILDFERNEVSLTFDLSVNWMVELNIWSDPNHSR